MHPILNLFARLSLGRAYEFESRSKTQGLSALLKGFRFPGLCSSSLGTLVDVSDMLLEMSGVEDLASMYSQRRAGVEHPAVHEAHVGNQEEAVLRQLQLTK